MRLMQEMDLTIEEVDALTGQAVGWPRSATFRTIDLVGLDILGHVVGNMTSNVKDERNDLRLADFFGRCSRRNGSATKPKAASTRKCEEPPKAKKTSVLRSIGGRSNTILARSRNFPALDMAKNIDDTGRSRAHAARPRWRSPQKADKAGVFLWAALGSVDVLRQPHARNFGLDR